MCTREAAQLCWGCAAHEVWCVVVYTAWTSWAVLSLNPTPSKWLPSSLHPTPYTPHPTPYTLHPTSPPPPHTHTSNSILSRVLHPRPPAAPASARTQRGASPPLTSAPGSLQRFPRRPFGRPTSRCVPTCCRGVAAVLDHAYPAAGRFMLQTPHGTGCPGACYSGLRCARAGMRRLCQLPAASLLPSPPTSHPPPPDNSTRFTATPWRSPRPRR